MDYNYRYVVCLGSNRQPHENLDKARKMLDEKFGDIQWGSIVQTTPEGTSHPAPYLNQAASFRSAQEAEAVKATLKAIERQCGRTPQGKRNGIIPLDIDLLLQDGRIFKPADMERLYVKQALESLPAER